MSIGEVSECTKIERETSIRFLNCLTEDAKFQKFSAANLHFISIIAGKQFNSLVPCFKISV